MEIPVGRTDVPIAVIGMACRLPGADNLQQFWQLLATGASTVVELPHERLDQQLYYDPRRGRRGKTYSKLGAIIASRQFDRQACPIPPELERGVDNAHLLMCQTAAEACRHAGLDPFNLPLRNAGVYIGHAQGSNLAGEFTFGTCIEEAAQFAPRGARFSTASAGRSRSPGRGVDRHGSRRNARPEGGFSRRRHQYGGRDDQQGVRAVGTVRGRQFRLCFLAAGDNVRHHRLAIGAHRDGHRRRRLRTASPIPWCFSPMPSR